MRFLDIAFGSLKEMRYQWSLSHRLGYCDKAAFERIDQQMEGAMRTLAGLIRLARRRPSTVDCERRVAPTAL